MIIGEKELKELQAQGLITASEAVKWHIIDRIRFFEGKGSTFYEGLKGICGIYGAPYKSMGTYLLRHGLCRKGGNGERRRAWAIVSLADSSAVCPSPTQDESRQNDDLGHPQNGDSQVVRMKTDGRQDEDPQVAKTTTPTILGRVDSVKEREVYVEVVTDEFPDFEATTTTNSLLCFRESTEDLDTPKAEIFSFEDFPEGESSSSDTPERSEKSTPLNCPPPPPPADTPDSLIEKAAISSPEDVLKLWLGVLRKMGVNYGKGQPDEDSAKKIFNRYTPQTIKAGMRRHVASVASESGGVGIARKYHVTALYGLMMNIYACEKYSGYQQTSRY